SDIVSILGAVSHIKNKTYASGALYYYKKNSIMVDFDDAGSPKAFQFSAPYDPRYDNVSFIGVPYSKVLEWFKANDDNLKKDGAGCFSNKLGIGVYAGSAEKAPEEPVQAIIVFRRGYYESNPPC
ncbi:MAG: hypothetical protein HC841_04820, partial [Verrucomicrobiae bacterium]|nr:hypothetical protein [Verrucomicrobiae bacterium]